MPAGLVAWYCVDSDPDLYLEGSRGWPGRPGLVLGVGKRGWPGGGQIRLGLFSCLPGPPGVAALSSLGIGCCCDLLGSVVLGLLGHCMCCVCKTALACVDKDPHALTTCAGTLKLDIFWWWQ